jgi:hypothetical protein
MNPYETDNEFSGAPAIAEGIYIFTYGFGLINRYAYTNYIYSFYTSVKTGDGGPGANLVAGLRQAGFVFNNPEEVYPVAPGSLNSKSNGFNGSKAVMAEISRVQCPPSAPMAQI